MRIKYTALHTMKGDSMDVQSLRDAALLLEAKRAELVNEPMAIYQVVAHAAQFVNNQLAAMLRGQ